MLPEMREKLRNLLISEEGYRQYVYTDITGHLTIAIGRNLQSRGITHDEALTLLHNDMAYFERKLSSVLPFFEKVPDERKIVLIAMAFNMGVQRLLGFKKMLAAVEAWDWATAAHEILDSKAARQLPDRYQRMSDIMRTGEV